MGNKESDALEVKAFNIVKNIPLVSQVYRIPRTIIYLAKENQEQAMRSIEIKVQNINPLKCIGGVLRGIAALKKDLSDGIWIGKRPLLELPLSLNFSPGFDLMHWAVMINHEIYEVTGGDADGICVYRISNWDKLRQTFHWYATDFVCLKTNSQVRDCVDLFDAMKRKYNLLAGLKNGQQENCQTFVLRLIERVCCVRTRQLVTQLLICADGAWIL